MGDGWWRAPRVAARRPPSAVTCPRTGAAQTPWRAAGAPRRGARPGTCLPVSSAVPTRKSLRASGIPTDDRCSRCEANGAQIEARLRARRTDPGGGPAGRRGARGRRLCRGRAGRGSRRPAHAHHDRSDPAGHRQGADRRASRHRGRRRDRRRRRARLQLERRLRADVGRYDRRVLRRSRLPRAGQRRRLEPERQPRGQPDDRLARECKRTAPLRGLLAAQGDQRLHSRRQECGSGGRRARQRQRRRLHAHLAERGRTGLRLELHQHVRARVRRLRPVTPLRRDRELPEPLLRLLADLRHAPAGDRRRPAAGAERRQLG